MNQTSGEAQQQKLPKYSSKTLSANSVKLKRHDILYGIGIFYKKQRGIPLLNLKKHKAGSSPCLTAPERLFAIFLKINDCLRLEIP